MFNVNIRVSVYVMDCFLLQISIMFLTVNVLHVNT